MGGGPAARGLMGQGECWEPTGGWQDGVTKIILAAVYNRVVQEASSHVLWTLGAGVAGVFPDSPRGHEWKEHEGAGEGGGQRHQAGRSQGRQAGLWMGAKESGDMEGPR